MPFIGHLLLDVLRDGNDNWYDVSTNPTYLISFPKITDWNTVSQAHREERELIVSEIPKFDLYGSEHDAPAEGYSTVDALEFLAQEEIDKLKKR